MTGEHTPEEIERLTLAALDDPIAYEVKITGRNGISWAQRYPVPEGHKARVVQQFELHDHPTDMVEQFAMDEPVRVDLPASDYLLVVYGIEMVPVGDEFPDTPGEPDE